MRVYFCKNNSVLGFGLEYKENIGYLHLTHYFTDDLGEAKSKTISYVLDSDFKYLGILSLGRIRNWVYMLHYSIATYSIHD